MHENGGRPLAAVFASPGRYIQGAGAVGRIGGVLEGLGSTRPLILGDP
jgi:glycerol dehydrogenase